MDWHTIVDDELRAIRQRLADRHAAEVARQRTRQWWRALEARRGAGETHEAIQAVVIHSS